MRARAPGACRPGAWAVGRARGGGGWPPAPVGFHAGQKALEGQESRQEVAVDRSAPSLLWDLLEWGGRSEAAARVGDEDVGRTEAVLDLVSHRLDVLEARDVADHRYGLPPVFSYGPLHLPEGVLVPDRKS